MKKNNKSKLIKKNILLISYHFPPSLAVGGLRIAYFANNLPSFGWHTYILTIKDRHIDQIDSNGHQDINTKKIFKTSKLPTILDLYSKCKTFLTNVLWKNQVNVTELAIVGVQPYASSFHFETAAQKIKRYIAALFMMLPDTEKGWIFPAVFRASWEIKRKNIGCILTSAPPYSVHLIGLLVNIITGVRWVADFRDPWMSTGSKRLFSTCNLSLKIEAWLEKQVVQRSDMVLANTKMLLTALKKSYKNQPKNKFLYIPNGFDTEVFSQIEHLNKYKQFTLSYTGSLYLGRSPEPIFKALRKLISENRLNIQDISIKLVGNCQYVGSYPTAPMINSYGLDSMVEVIDSVPYLRSLEIIKQSHLALLFAPDQPFQIPAKAFDYIGSGTKILAIAGEGATSDLINSTGAGESFYPSDIEGIKEFIYQSVNNAKSKRPESKTDMLHQFDRRVIIKKFADHLKSVI